jgi:hypothetical protein
VHKVLEFLYAIVLNEWYEMKIVTGFQRIEVSSSKRFVFDVECILVAIFVVKT